MVSKHDSVDHDFEIDCRLREMRQSKDPTILEHGYRSRVHTLAVYPFLVPQYQMEGDVVCSSRCEQGEDPVAEVEEELLSTTHPCQKRLLPPRAIPWAWQR